METIYSLILWDKMNRAPAECKIHEMKLSEIEKEFSSHLEKVGSSQFKQDIKENSFLDVQPNELYYDGQFYEFNDSHHKQQVQEDPSSKDRFLVKHIYHETMAESTILTLMMEHLNPDSSELLAKIHRAWYEKKKLEKKEEKEE